MLRDLRNRANEEYREMVERRLKTNKHRLWWQGYLGKRGQRGKT